MDGADRNTVVALASIILISCNGSRVCYTPCFSSLRARRELPLKKPKQYIDVTCECRLSHYSIITALIFNALIGKGLVGHQPKIPQLIYAKMKNHPHWVSFIRTV